MTEQAASVNLRIFAPEPSRRMSYVLPLQRDVAVAWRYGAPAEASRSFTEGGFTGVR